MAHRVALRLLGALGAGLALAAAGCAGVGSPGRDAAATAAGDEQLEPPDGRWLRDDQGREYFVARTAKTQARRLGPGDVRTHWGIRLDVVGEDENFFNHRIFRVGAAAPVEGLLVPEEQTPDPAALRRIAAAYRVDIPKTRGLRLEPFGRGLPQAGQWRQGFSVADLDGDGRLDIVHGPPRKAPGPPAVFLGDGAGGWRRWSDARWPRLPYDYGDAAVGDFNGDGRPDLALSVHLHGLIALVSDGAGRFTAAGRGLDFAAGGATPGFSSRAIRVADVDGDGRPDLLALADGPRPPAPGASRAGSPLGIAIYLNTGDGSWRRRDEALGPGRLFGDALALGDFDGDGRADLATGSGALGRTDLLHRARPDGGWETVALMALRPAALVRALAAADFDGDGRADLAVTYRSFEGGIWHTGIDVLVSSGAPLSRRVPVLASEGTDGATALAAGDLNGDGAADLAALTADGELLLFPGDGRGGFTRDAAGRPPFGPRCAGAHLEAADLDGDGRAELVGSFAEEEVSDPLGESGDSERAAPRCPSQGGLAAWKIVPSR